MNTRKIILIVGKAGSGKSTVAKSIGNTLHLDELVRHEFGGDFSLYRQHKRIDLQNTFCERIRQLIPYYDCIEGSIRDYALIRKIFAGYDWKLIFVIPHSAKTYAEFITKRFLEEPDYARITWLQEGDPDGTMLALKNSGGSVELFNKWIQKLCEVQYVECQRLAHAYADEFPMNTTIHINS